MRLAVAFHFRKGEVEMRERVRFGVILTQQEWEALGRLATEDGLLSKAAWLRRTIRREANRQGINLGDSDSAGLQEVQHGR